MDLEILESARTTALTTLARARREVGVAEDDDSHDEQLTGLIEEVSADVVAFLQRPALLRQAVTERTPGYGRTVLTLSLTPVPAAGVMAVRQRGEVVDASAYRVSNGDAGFLYREDCWPDTRITRQGIEANAVVMPGNPDFAVDYVGGYLGPQDDLLVEGVTVDATLHTFQLASDTFPLLVSGEYVTVRGAGLNVSNVGRHRVLARTASTLTVASTLASQSIPSGLVSFECRTLPRDIERLACLELRKRYLSEESRRDPTVVSEKLGDWSADYSGRHLLLGGGIPTSTGGLDPEVADGLQKYVRVE